MILKENRLSVSYDLKSRPAIYRALKNANSKEFDGFLIFKWDRIFRDPPFAKAVQVYLAKYGKCIIPTDDPEDPFASDIIQVVSKYEIDKMKERVRNTRLNQFEKGIIVGRCPFGYKPIFKDKKNRKGILRIEVHNKQAEIVKDIFEKTSKGISYKEICDEHGLKPQSYYNMIKNKVYLGIVAFEGEEKIGTHGPIISKELFEKVNKNA